MRGLAAFGVFAGIVAIAMVIDLELASAGFVVGFLAGAITWGYLDERPRKRERALHHPEG